MKMLTLHSASNIKRSTEVYTSKIGNDIGSTYFNFMCSYCHSLIGRYYLTTSSDLDHLREKFSFLVDELTSYEIGKSQIGTIPEMTTESDALVATVANAKNDSLQQEVAEIKLENTKVQLFFLCHSKS
jgi:hypothetical protein